MPLRCELVSGGATSWQGHGLYIWQLIWCCASLMCCIAVLTNARLNAIAQCQARQLSAAQHSTTPLHILASNTQKVVHHDCIRLALRTSDTNLVQKLQGWMVHARLCETSRWQLVDMHSGHNWRYPEQPSSYLYAGGGARNMSMSTSISMSMNMSMNVAGDVCDRLVCSKLVLAAFVHRQASCPMGSAVEGKQAECMEVCA